MDDLKYRSNRYICQICTGYAVKYVMKDYDIYLVGHSYFGLWVWTDLFYTENKKVKAVKK